MSDHKKTIHGWVLYDAECDFCRSLIKKFAPVLEKRGFTCVPLQENWVREEFKGIEDNLSEMRVLTVDRQFLGGADAVVYLAGKIWWAWGLFVLAHIPGIKFVLRKLYKIIAKNRHCLTGCRIRREDHG